MASFKQEIEFNVTCKDCGRGLDVEEFEQRGQFELVVIPCEHCMKQKDVAMDEVLEHINERENYIQELSEEIEALNVELSYIKIKKMSPVS